MCLAHKGILRWDLGVFLALSFWLVFAPQSHAQSAGALKVQEIYSSSGSIKLDSPIANFMDKGGQVFNVKAYGATGNGVTNDSPFVTAAYNAMPSCTISRKTWSHCGHMFFPAGTYLLDSGIAIDSPLVTITGAGIGATLLNFQGTRGGAITWTANPSQYQQSDVAGGVANLSITGNSSASIYGLETYDLIGFHMNHVQISGFTGTGSVGWWENAVHLFDERYSVHHAFLGNNTVDWKVQNQGTNGVGFTFGYGYFGLHITFSAGQVGVESIGNNTSNAVDFNESIVNITENGHSGTCAEFQDYSGWRVVGSWHCEQTAPLAGFTADSTSFLSVNGFLDSSGPDSGNVTSFNPQTGTGGFYAVQTLNPATSSANVNSPELILKGNVWNGRSSTSDEWKMVDALGSGANAPSTFRLIHSGPGTADVNVPTIRLSSPSSFVNIKAFDRAPSGSCRTGSLGLNTSGRAGTTLYVCEAGTWVAK